MAHANDMARQTLDQLLDAFDLNASYREDNSTSKAAAFETACLRLSVLPVESSQGNRQRIVMDPRQFARLASEAREWIQAQGAASDSVTFPDLQYLREAN